MGLKALLRSRIKAERKRGALWVRMLDVVRLVPTGEGRARLWTHLVHGGQVHQTTPYTCEDRYPELFDLAAKLEPGAKRILSFGCSTGAELAALRRRFPSAGIVGAEINARSRRIAARRFADDTLVTVLHPRALGGAFDVVFVLAVLQREPSKIEETDVRDLSDIYPFEQFDAAVTQLAHLLRPAGLLCVMHAQYRIEDSSAASELQPVEMAPSMEGPFFNRDGRRLDGVSGHSIFRKAGQAAERGGGRSRSRRASPAR
jgi:SAM-dependent methyltransferase